MKRSFWICCCCILAGCLLLAIPDADERLFSFNPEHGPSLADLTGIVILVITWAWMLLQAIRYWPKVYHRIKLPGVIISIVLVVTGSVLIISGIYYERNIALWTGTALAATGYSILFIAAFKK